MNDYKTKPGQGTSYGDVMYNRTDTGGGGNHTSEPGSGTSYADVMHQRGSQLSKFSDSE